MKKSVTPLYICESKGYKRKKNKIINSAELLLLILVPVIEAKISGQTEREWTRNVKESADDSVISTFDLI